MPTPFNRRVVDTLDRNTGGYTSESISGAYVSLRKASVLAIYAHERPSTYRKAV